MDRYLMSRIELFVVGVLTGFIIGAFTGGTLKALSMKNVLVKKGLGEYYLDENHDKQFRLILPPEPLELETY